MFERHRQGGGDAGETVRVESAEGEFLCWAAFSPQEPDPAARLEFDEAERIDAAFFARRIERAMAWRERLAIASDARRLIHAEADGLPGLVVDRYGDTLVAQFGSTGVERWKGAIADACSPPPASRGFTSVVIRSRASGRACLATRLAARQRPETA